MRPSLAPAGDEHLPLHRDGVLRAPQHTGPLGARRDLERDAAAVDDGRRHLALLGVAIDLVADPPGDLGDRRIDVGEGAQRLVAEAVARGAGGEHRLDERRLQQGLVAAGDADGDGLRLVLDGVDRAGELLDALGERGGEVVDHDRGRADPAVLGLVGVERRDAEGVAVRRRQPHRGAGLEVAVVGAVAQPVEEPRRRGGERGPQRAQQPLAVGDGVLADGVLDGGPRLAHRPRLRVDRQARPRSRTGGRPPR